MHFGSPVLALETIPRTSYRQRRVPRVRLSGWTCVSSSDDTSRSPSLTHIFGVYYYNRCSTIQHALDRLSNRRRVSQSDDRSEKRDTRLRFERGPPKRRVGFLLGLKLLSSSINDELFLLCEVKDSRSAMTDRHGCCC